MTSVYLLVDPSDMLHVRYVGIADNPHRRFNCHAAASRVAKKSYLRHWVDSLKARGELPTMIIVDRAERDAACRLEQEYIAAFRSGGHKLTNVSSGGEHSGSGVVCSRETRAKISVGNLGRKISVESRKRVSGGARKRYENDPGLARRIAIAIHAAYAADPDIRQRQSVAQSLRFQRPEEREKLRAAAIARTASPAYRARRSIASKRMWIEHRDKMLTAARSETRRGKISAAAKTRWAVAGARRSASERSIEHWKDAVYRAAHHDRRGIDWSDQSIASKRINGIKKSWDARRAKFGASGRSAQIQIEQPARRRRA